jgi:hypothetical protein
MSKVLNVKRVQNLNIKLQNRSLTKSGNAKKRVFGVTLMLLLALAEP